MAAERLSQVLKTICAAILGNPTMATQRDTSRCWPSSFFWSDSSVIGHSHSMQQTSLLKMIFACNALLEHKLSVLLWNRSHDQELIRHRAKESDTGASQ